MRCGEDILERNTNPGRQPKLIVAMCRACAKAAVMDMDYTGESLMPQESGKFCRDCVTAGTPSIAHRLIGKTPVCDSHFRERMGIPQLATFRAPPTCAECQQQGNHVAATRVVNGLNVCDEHAQPTATNKSNNATPAVETQKEEPQKMKLDKEQMQKDRDAGMKGKEIAKKHGCSISAVSVYTRRPESAAVENLRVKGRLAAIADRAVKPNGNGQRKSVATGTLADAIAELKDELGHLDERRGKLSQAIETLESIDA